MAKENGQFVPMLDPLPLLFPGLLLAEAIAEAEQRRVWAHARCAWSFGCSHGKAFLVRTETCANEQLAGKHTMAALGDSMSANVLMRIFVRALPAAGLWPSSLTRADRWSSTPKMELGRLADTLYKDIRG